MKGYSEFKIKLASEISSLILDEKRVEINMPIKENTNEEEIPEKFYKMCRKLLMMFIIL